jgi:(p)ppGpp synthase/HD superfamily hydrolase
MEFGSLEEKQAENFQKMALAMARDIRVILVKLADRLHNMRTLGVLHTEKARRIARETLEIYAPIAMRLGMNTVRMEFEDLGFSALYPMRARRIDAALRNARGHRKELVEKIRHQVETTLEQEGHEVEVVGREKHLYSIYKKMKSKRKSFSEIMDIYAFRIIVDSVDTCYRVLGSIHSLYKPVPGEFKDYIAIPKANGYQSLHTILMGMHGVPIEIQIRTRRWRTWPKTVSPPIGCTKAMANPPTAATRGPGNGCRAYWKCSNGRATPWSLSKASRSTCSPTKSIYSHPSAEF